MGGAICIRLLTNSIEINNFGIIINGLNYFSSNNAMIGGTIYY
jgi:hypothetical protein